MVFVSLLNPFWVISIGNSSLVVSLVTEEEKSGMVTQLTSSPSLTHSLDNHLWDLQLSLRTPIVNK